MSGKLKILGQSSPKIDELIDLYITPNLIHVGNASLFVCNQNSNQILFRVSIALAGASDDPKQYLYYDTALAANTTQIINMSIVLGPSDVIRVRTDTTSVSFNLLGLELELTYKE